MKDERRSSMRASMVGTSLVLCLVLALAITPSQGQEIDVTLIGAVPGPNTTGEIPAWEGHKNLPCPDDWSMGAYYPNPYKDEKPLFRIDHTNVDEHKDRLSPAQMMRLQKHEDFYMNIYPTHRNTELPAPYYTKTKKNQETCRLDENGYITGYNGGVPFPNPKDGLEAIWNVRRMYLGDEAVARTCRRTVAPNGRIKKMGWLTKVMAFGDARLVAGPFTNPEGYFQKVRQIYTFPPDDQGRAFLNFDYMDTSRKMDIWMYLPTMRRVRRAPTMRDGQTTSGEYTMDENGIEFWGDPMLWDWKLHGKKEMYVSDNNYGLWLPDAEDTDECWAQDLNPERMRWELHRVWVVEGTLKEGVTHPYSKRVGYYDEDCWQPYLGDRYDKRGKLYRMYEAYTYADPCQKMRISNGYVYMNLYTGRYDIFGGCRSMFPQVTIYNTGQLFDEDFTVQKLRETGR
jgi:hypothetical protein